MTTYQSEYQRSVSDAEGFWKEKAEVLDWFTPPSEVLGSDENGVQRWFVDGELNTCYLALDYHVGNGRADQCALIYDSPVTGNKNQFTYKELLNEVSLVAGAFKKICVEKGAVSFTPLTLPTKRIG